MPRNDYTRKQIAAAVETLFLHLSPEGEEEFERLVIEEGLLNRCECGNNVPIDTKVCDKCGREQLMK